MNLNENERIDDLEFKNLKIIQNKEGFCFGIDAVILSDFAKNIKVGSRVLDLGTGTGIIPILLCGKTKLSEVVGVEIQKDVCDMASRSAKLNGLADKFKLINANILELDKILPTNSFDVVVSNPPYKKINTGLNSIKEKNLISRHEVMANLEDFVRVAGRFLKDQGEIYIIHRPERIVDICNLFRKYSLEPKEIRLVFSNKDKPPKMLLVKAVKNAKEFLKFRENLYIYDENGNYTNEILKIYNKI